MVNTRTVKSRARAVREKSKAFPAPSIKEYLVIFFGIGEVILNLIERLEWNLITNVRNQTQNSDPGN